MSLAERIEAATGPGRELDAEIDALLGWSPVPNPTMAGGLIDMMHGPGGVTVRRNTPAYTGSIDAAMMLVPEGWRFAIMIVEDGRAAVKLWWPGDDAPNVPRLEPLFATPALALAAAAIRAGAK